MTASVSLPQARIPIGYAMVQGQRVPVEIDQEWMRSFASLLDRSGGVSGDTSFAEYLPIFFDVPHTDTSAQEALRAVDELRNELASTRSDLQAVRALLDQALAMLETPAPTNDLRIRVEQIEGRLM